MYKGDLLGSQSGYRARYDGRMLLVARSVILLQRFHPMDCLGAHTVPPITRTASQPILPLTVCTLSVYSSACCALTAKTAAGFWNNWAAFL